MCLCPLCWEHWAMCWLCYTHSSGVLYIQNTIPAEIALSLEVVKGRKKKGDENRSNLDPFVNNLGFSFQACRCEKKYSQGRITEPFRLVYQRRCSGQTGYRTISDEDFCTTSHLQHFRRVQVALSLPLIDRDERTEALGILHGEPVPGGLACQGTWMLLAKRTDCGTSQL